MQRDQAVIDRWTGSAPEKMSTLPQEQMNKGSVKRSNQSVSTPGTMGLVFRLKFLS